MTEWISVEDELPKTGTLVLVFVTGEFSKLEGICFGSYHSNDGWEIDYWISHKVPTHWMPLPNPPEKT
jgi:hypothetical protein